VFRHRGEAGPDRQGPMQSGCGRCGVAWGWVEVLGSRRCARSCRGRGSSCWATGKGGGRAVRYAGGRHLPRADGYILLAPFLGASATSTRPASGGWV